MKAKVAIVKNSTTPDEARIIEMVHEALELAGGLAGVIKPGDVVAIKGNFFAPYPPPISVDRRVAAALIRECRAAGASRVILTEAVSIGTKLGRGSSTRWIMDELGVTQAAQAAGGEVLCLEDDERVEVKVPGAISIGTVKYPKTLLDCDVLINLPCMKTHGFCLVTLGVKNFQGVLIDEQKYYAHRDDLEQKLVDVFKIRKPDFTLMDGITAMEGNGSGEHGKPHPMNLLIAGRDMVAVDAVTSACMGIDDPMDVTATRLADFDGIGCGDLSQIEVAGSAIQAVREKFEYPDKFKKEIDRGAIGVFHNVEVHIGGACRMCWNMATNIGKTLSKYTDEKWYLVVGADPKFPSSSEVPVKNVVFIGDCACSTTGNLKDLRNRILLEGEGVLAIGCPPYRPASAIVEDYLIRRGLLTREELEQKNEASRARTYEYYKTIDPTWTPLSEQK